MTLTVTRTGYSPLGAARPIQGGFSSSMVMTMGEFVLPASYTAGGESLTPDNMGLQDCLFCMLTVEPSAGATGKTMMTPQYNYDTQKIMCFSGVAATLATQWQTGDNGAAYTVRFVAFGHALT